MRKKADIAVRKCEQCGEEYKPTGNGQQFCSICRAIRMREAKKQWYHRNFPDAKPKEKSSEVCSICGKAFSVHFDGKSYCNLHYQRMRTYGNPDGRPYKSRNQYTVADGIVILRTHNGLEFRIDEMDLEKVLRHTWCFSKTGYLVANPGTSVIKLHRYLLDAPDDMVVDHKDGDPANNRRSNLRIYTPKDNARNIRVQKNSASGYLGIRKTASGKYHARIMVDGKEISIGRFCKKSDAVRARKGAEKKYFGDFAPSLSRVEQRLDIETDVGNN